jgi:hypothetical protein
MEANTQTQTALDMKPGARGRKSADGSAEVIKITPIKEGAAEVMKLMRRAESAKTQAAEALEALAERSGTNVSVLKKLFKASLKGNFSDVRRDVDQAADLFERVGELPGGGKGE